MRFPKQLYGSTDSVLLARAQEQDPEAWTLLVRLYGPLVNYWLEKAGMQHADREDVFQEVFQAVAKKLREFRRERPVDTFRGWVPTIVRSKLSDHFRRTRGAPIASGGEPERWFAMLVAPPVLEADLDVDEGEKIQLLRQALLMTRDRFEPRTWTAFLRMVVDQRTAPQVAQELGMTPENVRKAKSRVLRRLKLEFGELVQ